MTSMVILPSSPGFQFLTSERIPAELVLKTIQHLPFGDGKRIASLSACPRIKSLIETYEHSITRWFMQKELRHALDDFPYDKECGLSWLSRCVERYDVVDAVMDELTWRDNTMAVKPHNIALVNAGLLLLYRLVSIDSREWSQDVLDAFKLPRNQGIFTNLPSDEHKSRLEFLSSLPIDPVIAMYLALHHATLTARYHGHSWIHAPSTYGRYMDANQLSLRNELEFCFAEAMLSVGPDFLFDMLVNPADPIGEITLLNFYHDHGTHDWDWPCWGDEIGEFEPPRTQGPQRDKKERSLFTAMLERMAELKNCPLAEVRSRIEDDTSVRDHELAYLSLDGKTRLVRGFNAQ